MAEYTIKDVIIDCDDPRLKDAVGKQIYSAIIPYDTVMFANGKIGNRKSETLVSINRNSDHPFRCEKSAYPCIIIVKESGNKYVPFESREEFVDAWSDIKASEIEGIASTLGCFGVWLKYRTDMDDDYVFRAVTEIWNDGVFLGSDGEETTWKELLEVCQFIDGSPCGKLKEGSNG